jgi:DNA-binding MarR family transcriptional regulator
VPRELENADFERLLLFRTGLRRFLRWSEEQAQAAGVTAAQHQLILAIRGHVGADATQASPTLKDLASYLLLRHHSAVELVDRAERAGLVERFPDGDDHRVVHVSLTAQGTRVLKKLSALHLEELERLAPRMRALWQGLEV